MAFDSPRKMRQARWYAPEEIRLDEVDFPAPGSGEIVVKIAAALTCGTDFKTFKRGHPRLIKSIPAPFGHEMSGTVWALGSGVTGFKEGDRVAIGNSAPCGTCFYCKKGSFSLCSDLIFLNGAYSDYLLIPARIVEKNLYHIPDTLDFKIAALSEPLACVLHAFEKVTPERGEQMVLLGAGPMGVLFAQLAQIHGIELVAVARDRAKLENLRKWGAKDIVSLTEDEDALDKVKAAVNQGRGADIVIEAVGLPETWELATRFARPGGRVCFYGGCAKGTEVKLDTYRVHYEELQLFGVFHHTPAYFKRAVELLAQKQITPEGLIVGEYRLDQIHQVFQKGSGSHPLKLAVMP